MLFASHSPIPLVFGILFIFLSTSSVSASFSVYMRLMQFLFNAEVCRFRFWLVMFCSVSCLSLSLSFCVFLQPMTWVRLFQRFHFILPCIYTKSSLYGFFCHSFASKLSTPVQFRLNASFFSLCFLLYYYF